MAVIALNKLPVYPTLAADDADKVTTRVSFGGNVTSSIIDPCLSKFRKENLPHEEAIKLNDWNHRLKKSYTAIELHLEKRLSQLVVQAVTCYGTGLNFCEGHTVHQGFNAEGIYNPIGEDITLQAAHHATLPCIYASTPNSDRKFVYLYRSGIYDESQATIDLVKELNDADRAIDEKYRPKGADKSAYQSMLPSQLRNKTVDLLNRASKKELTPHQVAKKFAKALRKEIVKGYERETNHKVKDVLDIYRNKAEELQAYTEDANNFDLWLDLQLDDPELGKATKLVEKLEDEQAVSPKKIRALIKRKIDALPVVIRHEYHQKNNESRAPVHFLDMYHFHVLKRLKGLDREVAEKATSIDYATLKANVAEFGRVGKTKAILAENSAKIDELVREIKPFIAKASGRQVPPSQLVGLTEEKKRCLRTNIYRLRYEMIKADQQVQSVIKSKIESVLNSVKKESSKHLDVFFYRALLDHASTEAERVMFCKLLNISDLDLAQKSREIRINSRAHGVIETNATLISKLSKRITFTATGDARGTDDKSSLERRLKRLEGQLNSRNHSEATSVLFRKRLFDQVTDKKAVRLLEELLRHDQSTLDVRIERMQRNKTTAAERLVARKAQKIADISELALEEAARLKRKSATFRRKLMVELRLSDGMSQDHFKQIYKQRFPRSPMSDGTMSNLENGYKAITPAIVRQISDIFGVNEALFYPGHFAEA